MPAAVSTSAAASRLIFFFAIVHLLNQSVVDRPRQRLIIGRQPAAGDIARRCKLVILDVGPRAFGKAEEEHRPRPWAIGHQHPISARASLSRPRDPLLD